MASSTRPCSCFLRVAQRRRWQFVQSAPFPHSRLLHQTCVAHASSTKAKPPDGMPTQAEMTKIFKAIGGVDNVQDLMPPVAVVKPEREEKPRPGFFQKYEEDTDAGEDYEFQPDDISSLAHAELEQVRELRELERIIAWDMPLLHQHAQPFAPPTDAQPLRWKYTTFLGETHPASKKVVVEFRPASLPDLSPAQATKLLKLLGPRYHPVKDLARMSSDRYPTVAQNKRALGELLDRLLAEARDPTDMFEDIPLDTRHVKPRSKDKLRHLRFPEEWKLSEERVQLLREGIEARQQEETKRVDAGEIVEGRRLLSGVAVEEEFVAVRPRRKRR